MATPVRTFHLPLPEPTYRRLRDAARQAKQPATAIARYAIESWLRQERKAMLHEAIATYAAKVAGTRADLDPELEIASLEIASMEPWALSKKTRRRQR